MAGNRSSVTAIAALKRRLKRRGWCKTKREYRLMTAWFDRPRIITEGDSWFAYPPKNIIGLEASNVIDHIRGWTRDKASILRLESNGDEASNIVSGEQKHNLAKVLSEFKPAILLFSAGGNDIAGAWDLERLLNQYEPGFTAEQCLRRPRLNRKLKRIELAYRELLELCVDYSPKTVVITHGYDYPFPTGKGAKFLKGLFKTKGWIKRFMDAKSIPPSKQREVITILLQGVQERLAEIASSPANSKRFKVVATQGTLPNKNDWLNELHPTKKGFKKIAKKIYAEMRKVTPALPGI